MIPESHQSLELKYYLLGVSAEIVGLYTRQAALVHKLELLLNNPNQIWLDVYKNKINLEWPLLEGESEFSSHFRSSISTPMEIAIQDLTMVCNIATGMNRLVLGAGIPRSAWGAIRCSESVSTRGEITPIDEVLQALASVSKIIENLKIFGRRFMVDNANQLSKLCVPIDFLMISDGWNTKQFDALLSIYNTLESKIRT